MGGVERQPILLYMGKELVCVMAFIDIYTCAQRYIYLYIGQTFSRKKSPSVSCGCFLHQTAYPKFLIYRCAPLGAGIFFNTRLATTTDHTRPRAPRTPSNLEGE